VLSNHIFKQFSCDPDPATASQTQESQRIKITEVSSDCYFMPSNIPGGCNQDKGESTDAGT